MFVPFFYTTQSYYRKPKKGVLNTSNEKNQLNQLFRIYFACEMNLFSRIQTRSNSKSDKSRKSKSHTSNRKPREQKTKKNQVKSPRSSKPKFFQKDSDRKYNGKIISHQNYKDKLMRMDSNQRRTFTMRIQQAGKSLKARYKQIKDRNEKKRIEREIDEIDFLEVQAKVLDKYNKFDDGQVIRYEGEKLKRDTMNVLKVAQGSEREWGGGINIDEEKNNLTGPEKLVLRKGIKTAAKYDQNSDIRVHTHPDRKIVDEAPGSYFIKNLKIKSDKKTDLLLDLNSPIDYLPSDTDLRITQKAEKNQTDFVVSKDRIISLTKKNTSKTQPREYHKELMELAVVRAFEESPRSEKKARQMLEKYHHEVEQGLKKIAGESGIAVHIAHDSERPKYQLPDDSNRMKNFANEKPYTDFSDVYSLESNPKMKKKSN